MQYKIISIYLAVNYIVTISAPNEVTTNEAPINLIFDRGIVGAYTPRGYRA